MGFGHVFFLAPHNTFVCDARELSDMFLRSRDEFNMHMITDVLHNSQCGSKFGSATWSTLTCHVGLVAAKCHSV